MSVCNIPVWVLYMFLWSMRKSSLSSFLKFLLTRSIIDDALAAADAHCDDVFRSFLTRIPKSLPSVVPARVRLPVEFFVAYIRFDCHVFSHQCALFCIYPDLGLKSHLSNHFIRLSSSDFSLLVSSLFLITLHILVLSANILILDWIHDGTSFTNMMNSKGPWTEPVACSTPLNKSNKSEKLRLTLTLVFWLDRKSSIHFSRFPEISHCLILLINLVCGTMSNAFIKSRYITSVP